MSETILVVEDEPVLHETLAYSLKNGGHTRRCDWAREILKYNPKPEQQGTTEVVRAATSDMPTPARRPIYSALNCDRFA